MLKIKGNEAKTLKIYCIAILIQEILEKYSASERFGVTQQIYNIIVKKHMAFEIQIKELMRNKRKKISRKTVLHTVANKISDEVWKDVVSNSKSDSEIVLNSIILYLIKTNEEEMKTVYKIDHKNIYQKIELPTSGGDKLLNFDSIRFSRALLHGVSKSIDDIVEK